MNKPEQNKVTTPQTKENEKLTDEQLTQLNAGTAFEGIAYDDVVLQLREGKTHGFERPY